MRGQVDFGSDQATAAGAKPSIRGVL